jgi:hypothetical protein
MYEQIGKPKENKSRAVASTVAQKKSNVKQGFGFVDNRLQSSVQRNQQDVIKESNFKDKKDLIQRVPELAVGMTDKDYVAQLTTGAIMPIRAHLRDERSRADGTPQTLTMLRYPAIGGVNIYVHIHDAGVGQLFGHIDMGGNRYSLESRESDLILQQAQASGIDTEYSDAGGAQDWERGEVGHERK